MWRQCFFSLHNVYHSPSTGQVLHLSQWCRNGPSLFPQHSKHLVMLEDFCWVVWFAWSCCYDTALGLGWMKKLYNTPWRPHRPCWMICSWPALLPGCKDGERPLVHPFHFKMAPTGFCSSKPALKLLAFSPGQRKASLALNLPLAEKTWMDPGASSLTGPSGNRPR